MADPWSGLRAALVTVPIVLAGTGDWDPHILTLVYPGRAETIPATSPATCAAAIDAIRAGRWRPLGGPPEAMRCDPGNLFPPGSDKISGRRG